MDALNQLISMFLLASQCICEDNGHLRLHMALLQCEGVIRLKASFEFFARL